MIKPEFVVSIPQVACFRAVSYGSMMICSARMSLDAQHVEIR